MARSKAKAAKGTTVEIEDGETPDAFIKIGELKTIPIPAPKEGTIDVTTHDSGGYKEFIADGVAETDEMTLECVFDASNLGQQEINSSRGQTRKFKITLPDHATDPTKFEFDAVVLSEVHITSNVGSEITGSFAIKPTGARSVTWAGGGA